MNTRSRISSPLVYRACLSRTFVSLRVIFSPFGFEGRMRDLILSIPDLCVSIHFQCHAFGGYCRFSKQIRQEKKI